MISRFLTDVLISCFVTKDEYARGHERGGGGRRPYQGNLYRAVVPIQLSSMCVLWTTW